MVTCRTRNALICREVTGSRVSCLLGHFPEAGLPAQCRGLGIRQHARKRQDRHDTVAAYVRYAHAVAFFRTSFTAGSMSSSHPARTARPMLQTGAVHTAGIRSRFEAAGVVRLQGAFAAEQAAAMAEAVWASRRTPGRAPPRRPRQLGRFARPELAGPQA